jgi:hypothetical protein
MDNLSENTNHEVESKSIITIERTFLEYKGVPCVRRIMKEDGVVYYKDAARISDVFGWGARTIDNLEIWLDDLKHPQRPKPKRHSSPKLIEAIEKGEVVYGSEITKDQFCEDLQSYCENIGL